MLSKTIIVMIGIFFSQDVKYTYYRDTGREDSIIARERLIGVHRWSLKEISSCRSVVNMGYIFSGFCIPDKEAECYSGYHKEQHKYKYQENITLWENLSILRNNRRKSEYYSYC